MKIVNRNFWLKELMALSRQLFSQEAPSLIFHLFLNAPQGTPLQAVLLHV